MFHRLVRMMAVFLTVQALPFLGAVASGQEPVGADAAAGEVIDVFEVTVQVKVTDRDGDIVHGLERDAFKLKEDGKSVRLTGFSAPRPGPGALSDRAQAGEEPTAPSGPPPTLIYLFDETSLPRADRRIAVEQLRERFRQGLEGPGSGVSIGTGIAAYDGALRIVSQPTDDAEELIQGLESLEGNARNELRRRERSLTLNQTLKEISEIRAQFRSRLVEADEALRRLESLARQADVEAQEQVAVNRERYASFATLVEALGTQPGRKAVVLISAGFPAFPGRTANAAIEAATFDIAAVGGGASGGSSINSRSAALGALSDSTPSKPRRRRGKVDTPRDMETLAAIAARAGVGFYAWKSRVAHGGAAAELGGDVALGLSPDLIAEQDDNLTAALELLAEETGGRTRRGGALTSVVDEATDDFGHFYSLTFSPRTGIDGRLHDLKVKVKGRGLKVWHPRFYLATPTP